MYQPLADFLFSEQAGFPRGSVHMKNVRTNPFEKESYRDIWTLIANGSQQATFDQKVAQISLLLTRFPERKFILIGDSGEKDPEVFNEIRRKFPSRIRQILIRSVTADAADNPARYSGMTLIPHNASASYSCSEVIIRAVQ
jgi:phosphatidate phosphatase APP1